MECGYYWWWLMTEWVFNVVSRLSLLTSFTPLLDLIWLPCIPDCKTTKARKVRKSIVVIQISNRNHPVKLNLCRTADIPTPMWVFQYSLSQVWYTISISYHAFYLSTNFACWILNASTKKYQAGSMSLSRGIVSSCSDWNLQSLWAADRCKPIFISQGSLHIQAVNSLPQKGGWSVSFPISTWKINSLLEHLQVCYNYWAKAASSTWVLCLPDPLRLQISQHDCVMSSQTVYYMSLIISITASCTLIQ
jgi:hypothetical protein